jgi:ArsR family transcriptional regulator, arsenate/arsenite/antimonite-responsive transcriptional repressor
MMELSNAVQALTGLAQLSRLAVFKTLVAAGPDGAQPTAIAESLDIPANTLSFHLKGLMTAKLVTQEKRGRMITYRADFTQMNALLEFLTANCCGGKACAVTAPLRAHRTKTRAVAS